MTVTELMATIIPAITAVIGAYFVLRRGQSQDKVAQSAADEKAAERTIANYEKTQERLLERVETLEKRLDSLQDKYQRALELLAVDRASPSVRTEIRNLLKKEQ